jgi:hypothetical protein
MFVMSTASGLAAQDDGMLAKGQASARVTAPDAEQPTRRRFQIGVGLMWTTTVRRCFRMVNREALREILQ